MPKPLVVAALLFQFNNNDMKEYIPGLAGVPATKSAISSIDGEKGILAYRGYSIQDLVEHSSFEETALLLMNGELPSSKELTNFKNTLKKRNEVKRKIRHLLWSLPSTGHSMDVLQTAIASMATFYPDAVASEPDSVYTQNALIKIISNMSTLVAMWTRISRGYDPIPPSNKMSYAENFMYMCFGEESDPAIVNLLDASLILHAEHTINASTFSTMVTASSLANPFASIAAGVELLLAHCMATQMKMFSLCLTKLALQRMPANGLKIGSKIKKLFGVWVIVNTKQKIPGLQFLKK